MVEAVVGLAGVIVGSTIVVAYYMLSDRRSRTRRSKYLAIVAVSILDEYIRNCDDTIHSAWMTRELGIHYRASPLPSGPSFPSDLDWSILDDQMVYCMLMLGNRTATANQHITYLGCEVASPPLYEEAVQATEEHYEALRSSASNLAEQLRSSWKLPKSEES